MVDHCLQLNDPQPTTNAFASVTNSISPRQKQYKKNVSTEKINAARGLLQELKGHGGGAAVAAMGDGPAASAADMPALVGALERLVEAYIELAMVGVDTFGLACFRLRLPFLFLGVSRLPS